MTSLLEQVLGAIHTLYNGNETSQMQKASEFLDQFQKTQQAWSLADSILMDVNLSSQAHFFAAMVLHNKLRSDFARDLGQHLSAQISLRDSIIAHTLRYKAGESGLILRLCLCIATLSLQMGERWDSNELETNNTSNNGTERDVNSVGVVNQMIKLFGVTSETSSCLLTILQVLPEECISPAVKVPQENRRYVGEQLGRMTPQILRWLSSFMGVQGLSQNIQIQVFRCMINWLRAGQVSVEDLASNPLVSASFDTLYTPGLFQISIEVICELVALSGCRSEYEPLVNYLMGRIIAIIPSFQHAVASEDEETVQGFVRVFCEAGDSWLALIADAHPSTLPIVEALLQGAAFPVVDVSMLTLRFWHMLAEVLSESEANQTSRPNQYVIEVKDKNAKRQYFISTFFVRLTDILVNSARYPLDFEDYADDQKEDFRRYRKIDLVDAFRGQCLIMGGMQCLSRIFTNYQHNLADYERSSDWRAIEASLFAIRSVARCVNLASSDSDIVSLILQSLPKLPDHKEIQYTAVLVAGRYAEWLVQHTDFFPILFQFIINRLASPNTTAAAALSFKNICVSCKNVIGPHTVSLIDIYAQVQTLSSLRLEDHCEILEGLGYVISNLTANPSSLNGSTIGRADALRNTCVIVVNQLRTLMTTLPPQSPSLSKSSSNSYTENSIYNPLSTALNKLATFLKFLEIGGNRQVQNSGEDPSLGIGSANVLKDLWPVIDQVLSGYVNDIGVMEQAVRCTRYIIESLNTQYGAPLLSSFVTRISECYKVARHACFLYVGATLVRVFARPTTPGDPIAQGLFQLMADLTTTTFSEVPSNARGFGDHPDLVQEYTELVVQFINKYPIEYFQSPLAATTFQWALPGVTLHHREASKSVVYYYKCLIKASYTTNSSSSHPPSNAAYYSIVRDLLSQHGHILLREIVVGAIIEGKIPTSRLARLTDLLQVLKSYDASVFGTWFTALLNQISTQTSSNTNASTDIVTGLVPPTQEMRIFFDRVVQGNSEEEIQLGVDEFFDICRRYRGD